MRGGDDVRADRDVLEPEVPEGIRPHHPLHPAAVGDRHQHAVDSAPVAVDHAPRDAGGCGGRDQNTCRPVRERADAGNKHRIRRRVDAGRARRCRAGCGVGESHWGAARDTDGAVAVLIARDIRLQVAFSPSRFPSKNFSLRIRCKDVSKRKQE